MHRKQDAAYFFVSALEGTFLAKKKKSKWHPVLIACKWYSVLFILMGSYGFSRILTGPQGFSRILTGPYGPLWNFTDPYGPSWIFMDPQGFL